MNRFDRFEGWDTGGGVIALDAKTKEEAIAQMCLPYIPWEDDSPARWDCATLVGYEDDEIIGINADGTTYTITI